MRETSEARRDAESEAAEVGALTAEVARLTGLVEASTADLERHQELGSEAEVALRSEKAARIEAEAERSRLKEKLKRAIGAVEVSARKRPQPAPLAPRVWRVR